MMSSWHNLCKFLHYHGASGENLITLMPCGDIDFLVGMYCPWLNIHCQLSSIWLIQTVMLWAQQIMEIMEQQMYGLGQHARVGS